ncbi:hypothetical protein PC121_g21502 [Phytophthora cactorum]|nr:hypothetical protein PC121_g21502 [Phytophthora cactorum]
MSAFDSFVSAHLRLAPGKTAKTTDVVAAYTAFTGGSAGKLKLYAHVKAMEGVKKVRQTFTGIELIEFVNAPAKISNELPEKSPEVIRLEIEMRRIALEERKEEREAMKTKHAKEMEERRAALKAMEIEGAKDIEAMKVTSAKDIEAMKEASAGRLKAMDLEWEKEKVERQEAEKIRDREFWAAENNKNRKMYVETERWNRYLDMRVYGTPSKQYIERDSLFDNFDFRVFDAIGKIDAPARALIREEIDSASVTLPVWEREAIRPYEVVDVDHVTEVIDRVMEKIEAGREAMK